MREAWPLLVIAAALVAGTAAAGERAADLVDSFQSFCVPGPPNFAAVEAKAAAMNLSVRKDVGTPRQPGPFSHSKSWLVSLPSGALELVASEARGPRGEAAACGVGAEDADGEAVKQQLVRTMKLEAPLRQTASADGTQRVTVWTYGAGVTLVLADGTPMKIPGIYLTLLQQATASP